MAMTRQRMRRRLRFRPSLSNSMRFLAILCQRLLPEVERDRRSDRCAACGVKG